MEKLMIFVTDEGRDIQESGLTLDQVEDILVDNSSLNGGWTLSAILNIQFDPFSTLGAKANGDEPFDVYESVPSFGYSSTISVVSPVSSGFGTTEEDYFPLVVSTEGYAWSINTVRQGGVASDDLLAAFVASALETLNPL